MLESGFRLVATQIGAPSEVEVHVRFALQQRVVPHWVSVMRQD